jgi:hypothetical protein
VVVKISIPALVLVKVHAALNMAVSETTCLFGTPGTNSHPQGAVKHQLIAGLAARALSALAHPRVQASANVQLPAVLSDLVLSMSMQLPPLRPSKSHPALIHQSMFHQVLLETWSNPPLLHMLKPHPALIHLSMFHQVLLGT